MNIDPQNEIWVTRDLRQIPIAEMSDAHIYNTLAMLKRNAEEDKDTEVTQSWNVAIASGENAAEDGGDASEELSRSHWTRWGNRMWVPLFKEALRRGGGLAQKAVDLL